MTQRFLKSKSVTATLAVMAVAVGVLSITTASWVNRLKSQITNSEAAGCSLSFSIATPTPSPSPSPSPTPIPTATPTPLPTPTIPACVESPVKIVIALDRSGTMGQQGIGGKLKIDWAKEAAVAFVNTIRNLPAASRQNVTFGVISWAGNNRRVTSIGPTNNFDTVINFINGITNTSGDNYTCIECAIARANTMFGGFTGRKALILMSDGIANRITTSCTSTDQNSCSNPTPPACTNDNYLLLHCPAADTAAINAATNLKNSGVKTYVVGYGINTPPVTMLEDNLKAISGDNDSANNPDGDEYYLYGGSENNWANVFTSIAPRLCSETGTAPTSTPIPSPTPTPSAVSCAYGPYAIPGRIEAENYTCGGQGVAYNDTTRSNEGGQYRTNERVDIQRTNDTSGGTYNVGWMRSGEWLKYNVNVTSTGTYRLTFRVASNVNNRGKFRLLIDDRDVTGQKTVARTGSWQTFTNIVVSGVNLTTGPHTLRLNVEGSDMNLNFIDFTRI